MATKNKKTKDHAPLVGRLGSEAFLALVKRKAGAHHTDKRDVKRSVAKRRALSED